MKSTIIILTLIFITVNAHSQQTASDKQQSVSKDYLKKSQNQRKAGFILLGSGVGLIATSIIIPQGEQTYDGICIGYLCDDKYKNDGIKSAFFIAGGVAALSSIPFFIMSGKNRRRANAVSFKMENTWSPYYNGVAYSSFPAASIRLRF